MVGSTNNRRPRVLISQQGCIPIYRKSFFHRLNEFAAFDYVVVHGSAPRGTDYILATPPFDFPNIAIENHELRIAGRSCIWQPVVWRVIRGEFDAAVIGEEIKFVSNLAIALVMRLRRRPVLIWGFGFHQYVAPQNTIFARIAANLVNNFKKLFFRIASGFLVYTEGGMKALQALPSPPKRVVVLKNTIDVERESRFRAVVASESLDEIFKELGVRKNSVTLLYFGRLVPMKHVDLLVEYAKRCGSTGLNVDVIIFGQGSEEKRLHSLASNLKNVVFHHHDDLRLARALRISAAVVIPGYVGLAVTHGFAHGIPTLTRRGQLHSPEIEYLEDGVNGLILPESPDGFFDALDLFVADGELQRRLAQGAERTASTIKMDHMVAAFHNFVCDCLTSRGKAPQV